MPQVRAIGVFRSAAAFASLALFGVGLSLVGGCASGGGGGAGAGLVSERGGTEAALDRVVGPFRELGMELDWTVQPAETTERPLRFLEVAGDRLLVHDDENVLTVRDAGTGRYVWRERLGASVLPFAGHVRYDGFELRSGVGTPAPVDVLVTASRSELFIRELDSGSLIDRQRLAFLVSTPPLKAGGAMLAFGSLEGRVLFHRADSDVYAFQFALNSAIEAPLTRVGGAVGAVDASGTAAVIDAVAGESVGGLFSMFAGAGGAPVADDRTMYVASRDQSIYAFDTSIGETRWRIRTERALVDDPTLRDGVLYVAVPSRGLLAIDAFGGRVMWECAGVDRGTVIGRSAGELMVWDGEAVTLVDQGTGDLIERIELTGVRDLRVEGFDDPAVYASFDTGRLAKFRPGL